MRKLDVRQVTSSIFHPELQGALERFYQRLKSVMRIYCTEHFRDWDSRIPYPRCLFAPREVMQESHECSPLELVYVHTIRGPLGLVKEKWSGSDSATMWRTSRPMLRGALELAGQSLKSAQCDVKV